MSPTPKTPGGKREILSQKNMDKFRLITAAGGSVGLIAIIGFLANIQTQLDRNCYATDRVGKAVIGVVSVDDELNKPHNEPLRRNLIQQLQVERCGK